MEIRLRLENREGGELHLRRASSEERAFMAEHLPLHEAHGRAAQDDEEIHRLPVAVNQDLQEGRDARIRFGKVWIFIDDEHEFFVSRHRCDGRKRCREIGIDRGIPVAALRCIDALAEILQIFFCRRLECREENGMLVLAEFPD